MSELAERVFKCLERFKTLCAAIVAFKSANFVMQTFLGLAQFINHALDFGRHGGGGVFGIFKSREQAENRLVYASNGQRGSGFDGFDALRQAIKCFRARRALWFKVIAGSSFAVALQE